VRALTGLKPGVNEIAIFLQALGLTPTISGLFGV